MDSPCLNTNSKHLFNIVKCPSSPNIVKVSRNFVDTFCNQPQKTRRVSGPGRRGWRHAASCHYCHNWQLKAVHFLQRLSFDGFLHPSSLKCGNKIKIFKKYITFWLVLHVLACLLSVVVVVVVQNIVHSAVCPFDIIF